MRKFELINTRDETWDLNALSNFMTEPKGLGFELKTSFENYNNTFYEKSRELKQPKIQGTINFKEYETYDEFVKFCQFKPLELAYTTFETSYIKCELAKLEKTEIEEGYISSKATFVGLTPFFKKVTKENDISTSGGKTYSYTYPYNYVDSDTGEIEVEVDSNLESGVKLTFFGPIENPVWNHFVNGNKMVSGKVVCEIPNGHKLVVDSSTVPYSIIEYDTNNNLIEDRYKDSDFNTKRFVILGFGTNTISATHLGTTKIEMIMEAQINYESV